MAPTRPSKKGKRRDRGVISRAAGGSGEPNSKTVAPLVLVKAAEVKIQVGNPTEALALAEKALDQAQSGSDDALAALNLLGQISLELGEFDQARSYFLKAVALDEDGTKSEQIGGGSEKFLCLAQLSDEGGKDSAKWFEKGASALRNQIQALEALRKRDDEQEMTLEDLRKKLSMTLCAVAELYMTDLSWEADAEQRCERLVTEATMIAPEFAESWQTLANVRISQQRVEDAKAALLRSMELWKDLTTEDPSVPDFPSRVALARLLMEVEMEQEALEVLERLVGEDDHAVEVWYLGGWGLFLTGQRLKEAGKAEDEWKSAWLSSRTWLSQCMHLFEQQDYEDDRLGEHSKELLAALGMELSDTPDEDEDDDEDDDDDEGWEDDAGSDEEME